jgi:hypothetical protein
MPPIYGSADRLAQQTRVYGPPAPPPRASAPPASVPRVADGPSGREIVDRHTSGATCGRRFGNGRRMRPS